MAKTADSPQTFEAALAELEEIVGRMEGGQLPLKESLAAYKRGAELLTLLPGIAQGRATAGRSPRAGRAEGVRGGRRCRCILTSRSRCGPRRRQRRIEDVLDRALPRADALPAGLHEAMRYAVLGGGKRIRPLLAYAAGEFADADPAVVDAPAAAVELIHAYSLVHDDLPCMDNDTLRRGKPTCHVAFGEADGIARRRRAAVAGVRPAGRKRDARVRRRMRDARGRGRRARHGGGPGDRPREFRHRAVVARTADDASDEDRRAHTRSGAAGRRLRTPA